ncbi:MAG: HAMP domain-containing protein [Treponema sp.]|nr:HAMP domain-containing protein [Treponema sp.]
MNNTSIFRKTSFAYTIIITFLNAAVNIMILSSPQSSTIQNDIAEKWQTFVNSIPAVVILVTFGPFTLPLILCLCYILKKTSEEKTVKRAVSLPMAMATATFLGWISNIAIMFPTAVLAKNALGLPIRIILTATGLSSFMIGISMFTMTYLILENLNQKYLLPKLFPNGKVSSVKTLFRPTFGVLLAMTFLISSIWPVTSLLSELRTILINSGLTISKGLLFITFVPLLTAAYVTFMLSKKIVIPLKKLTQATEHIKMGDYKTRLNIITNDEMGILADTFNDMTASLEEKEFIRDTFGKVVDPNVRDYLIKNGKSLQGESREVTVLFCDIRNFTAMSEKMMPSEVVSLLNRYFTALGKCISAHRGIINKYIGDAIMAIFGVPMENEKHAQDACLAAIDMREALAQLNEELCTEGKNTLRFGIGMHTGKVFAGTIGATDRMEYTIIGDTVNTASRMESLCKTYSTDILLSEATLSQLSDELKAKGITYVDEASIRGKEDKIKIYTLNAN